MTANETMLEQCRSDIEKLREEEKRIIKVIDDAKELEWLVAISKTCETRVILNLERLSVRSKDTLAVAIRDGTKWISFTKSGELGIRKKKSCERNDGLRFYGRTEIVF